MPLTLREMQMMRVHNKWNADTWAQESNEFALAHFTQLTIREGYRRAPWFMEAQRGKAAVVFDGERVEPVFYECDRYDKTTRQCLAYDERPPFCRGYPHFGGELRVGQLLPEACEYRRDIGEKPTPIPVMLARKNGEMIA